jgi:hypothetical protein
MNSICFLKSTKKSFYFIHLKSYKLGMVAHALIPVLCRYRQEDLEVYGLPGFHRETLSQKTTECYKCLKFSYSF